MTAAGRIVSIDGAVIRAEVDGPIGLGEVVHAGDERLLGEVVALDQQAAGAVATAQIYEDTTGLRPGAPFHATGEPLTVELGPGLLGRVFDGIQRPLAALAAAQGDFLARGLRAPALDRDRLWPFEPRVERGAAVGEGQVLGVVRETEALEHRILVPPSTAGVVVDIAPAGPRRVEDVVARLEVPGRGPTEITLMSRWRVRSPRPFRARLAAAVPMITGQRVLDTFFPLPRGSAAGLPGGFGTGKTVLQYQLCKWSDADVIVFVGCGERGNEMTRLLRELPELSDPRTGRPLAERTVLVANTSNMPVSAREASLHTGVTMAEYYRDQGYNVALLADSTSRWAEALREISGRLGEMPAEEGYPPYLSSRLASYYERAGRVTTLGGGEGSVTLISAISPAGGDLTEPVTRHTRSYARVFWTLDRDLAAARHFPAVSTASSYSDVPAELESWWTERIAPDWPSLRRDALALLEDAARLEGTARLIGAESLPDRQRFILWLASLVEEGFLAQGAYDPIDASCSPARQAGLLRLILAAGTRGLAAVQAGVAPEAIAEEPAAAALARARSTVGDGALDRLGELAADFDRACERLQAGAHHDEGRP